MIEMRDLLTQDEVLQQRRTARAHLERVLVVAYANALICRERLIGIRSLLRLQIFLLGVLIVVGSTLTRHVAPLEFAFDGIWRER